MKTAMACLLFLVLAACKTDPVSGRKSYNWYALETDIRLGRQVMDSQLEALQKKEKAIDAKANPRIFKTIRDVSLKIASVSHVPEFPWQIHLADLDIVNAWCAPGGQIMVYSGLYAHEKKALVNPKAIDEFAAILGHEMAHATARHVTEALSQSFSFLLLGRVAGGVLASSGAELAANVFNEVYSRGLSLYIPAYSRKNEAEADRIGLFYMARAGYNPQAAVDLWYRACQRKGERISIYASHPSSCQRAKTLERYLPPARDLYQQVHAGVDLPVPPEVPGPKDLPAAPVVDNNSQ